MDHAIRANGIRYWLRLSWNTIRYYVSKRRWRALTRAAWLTIIRGYYLEICQLCGRKVSAIWWSDEKLWNQAVPNSHGAGLLCMSCFAQSVEVAKQGCYVVWRPELWRNGVRVPTIAKEVI